MERYDIAIIGTGPAGVSAAITASARNKKVALFGKKNLSEKLEKAQEIRNYPGFPDASGAEIQAAFLKHLDAMGVEITEEKVALIYPMGDYFSLQTETDIIEATTVILASGVITAKPYPGEDRFLGMGVSYCATCDAALYRGKTCAVIAQSPKEEPEAEFLAEFANKVVYFPLYSSETSLTDNIEVRRETPKEITGMMKAGKLVTDLGEYDFDGIFILRDSIAPGKLVPGLETDGAHVKVARDMSTNVPGCFAAGDITGTPYQYIKAAGEGNVAALSAVNYIAGLKRGK